jgi:hypothetical protein
MSRTHKTGRFRASRERTLDVVERITGRRVRSTDLTVAERGMVISDDDYSRDVPLMTGLRYGNQRGMRAALKVSKRRRQRRADSRIPEGE